jgi:hypothetical protein
MSPKVVESKLIFKGEDQVSAKMEKISAAIEKMGSVAEEASDNLERMMTATTGAAPTRGARGRTGVSAQRSPYAPATSGQVGFDAIKERGGTGYGGKPYFGWRGTGPAAAGLGAVARAPGMMAGVVGGAAGGAGLSSISGMMQGMGAGVMGAFGGFGAIAGLPLLALGATLGIAHMVTRPGLEYYTGTAGVGARLGRPFVERMRAAGVRGGITPMEMAQILPGLERTGAQKAFPAMSLMKLAGLEPGMLSPLFGALTTAGGAGARGPAEYAGLGKMIQQAVKDTHSIPQLLEKLVSMTELVEQHTADMGEQGAREVMAIGKWMEAAPTAALRGVRGARVFGALTSWAATPGEPGKEMLIWSTLSRDESFRRSLLMSTYGTLGGTIGTQGPLTYMQYMRARGRPETFRAMLASFAGMGDLGELLMHKAGIEPETAAQLRGYYEKGGLASFDEQLKKAEKEGKLGPKGGALDPGQELSKMRASIESQKVDLASLKTIAATMDLELNILRGVKGLLDKVHFEDIVTTFDSAVQKFNDIVSGKENMIDLIGKGVAAGLSLFFGFGGKRDPRASWTPEDFAMSKSAATKEGLRGELIWRHLDELNENERLRRGYLSGGTSIQMR